MFSLPRFTLRIAIQTIFISIFVLLVGIIISLSTFEYSKSIELFSKKLMAYAATNVMESLESRLRPIEQVLKISQSLIAEDLIQPEELVKYSYFVAKSFQHYVHNTRIRVSVWGNPKGDSIGTILESDGSYSTEILKPNSTPPVSIKLYRDLSGKPIRSEAITSSYDARTRPWYLSAEKAGRLIWSKPFLSEPGKILTVSSAVPIYNNQKKLLGIYEMSLKLIGISNFLSTVKISPNSHIFILNDKNELLTYEGNRKEFIDEAQPTKINELKAQGNESIVTAMQLYNKTHQDYFRFKSDGNSYLAYYKPIPGVDLNGLKIGIIVPENDFTGPLKTANTIILIVSLVILIIGALLTRFFSRLISFSLNLLVKDTQRIKEFHLDDPQILPSHIAEISFLADAMESMKKSLRAFKKFVPTDLVRQLIKSGEGDTIGGVNKNITAFFSDIRGFTTMSENMEPERIMLHLCDYFEELSTIISAEQGTIDKFIGDSIMAFWGAPIADEQHCFHACEAALKCKARLAELNTKWEKQNKPQLITGIGIHTGTAIVGNIGSHTRLNYTAIGDTINFTSRLEAQSKKHGSIIIVSEDVVHAVKEQFVFRFIEKAEIRGKAGTHNLYELVEKR